MRLTDRTKKIPGSGAICIDRKFKLYKANKTICKYSKELNAYYNQEIPKSQDRDSLEQLHEDNNLYNPSASRSYCYIKYTKQKHQLEKRVQCTHRQAPPGFRPEKILGRATPAISLNRTLVQMQEGSMSKDIFRAQKTRCSF